MSKRRVRYLLLFIAFLFCVHYSYAQQVFTQGNSTSLNEFKGAATADSSQRVPKVKKVYPYWDSTGSICVVGGIMFYHNGTTWVALGTGSGSVTSVATGYGAIGGTITTTGTISADTTKVVPFTDTSIDIATRAWVYGRGFGSGSVTSVGTSTGLIGGTITTSGTLQIDSTKVPKWDDTATGNQWLVTPYFLSTKGYGTGTVTSVVAGTGLSGGTITTTGTISMPNTGTAGTYGSATQTPVLTTDAQGRVTAVTNTSITFPVTTSNTVTLTNKRWTARCSVQTTVSATPSCNTDNYDVFEFTAQTANITNLTTNLTGTPNDGDVVEFQITGSSGAITLSFGSSFVSSTVTIPTTTTSTTTLTIIFQYYSNSSYGNNKWVCVNYY